MLDIHRDINNQSIIEINKDDDAMMESNGDNASNSMEHVVKSIADMEVGSQIVTHMVQDCEFPYSTLSYLDNTKSKRNMNET